MKEIGEKQRKLESEAAGPRRAGEFLASEFDRFPPRPMFDAYWREGELALLFGPADAGKSLLAMQVADAIGRGRPIEGFEMPRSRRKVLYLDLKHSDRQFAERYSYWVPVQNIGSVLKGCKFAENLYRSRPRADEELCEWLTRQISEHGFNVVIVDDLTALKKGHDDVRETLA
ncbi:MAG TPA: AAA family ATPase, partial [Pyrinomonadaceae bacterium]|nr:AAA family ATPase [Pyrinomonadaceae bacterium]